MVEIRTRPDGSKYPITPKKGAGAAVAAVMVGSVVALGAGGTGGVAVGGAVDSAVGNGANRIVGQAVRARVSRAKLSARSGRRVEAWVRMGLKQIKREVDEQFQCAIHSYGQVRQFFLSNPCESLERELIAVVDEDGNTFLVSVSWVEMPSVGQAERLKAIADAYGTGNISRVRCTDRAARPGHAGRGGAGSGATAGTMRGAGEHCAVAYSRGLTVLSMRTKPSRQPNCSLVSGSGLKCINSFRIMRTLSSCSMKKAWSRVHVKRSQLTGSRRR